MGSAAIVHRATIPIARKNATDAIASKRSNLTVCIPSWRYLSGTLAKIDECKTLVSS